MYTGWTRLKRLTRRFSWRTSGEKNLSRIDEIEFPFHRWNLGDSCCSVNKFIPRLFVGEKRRVFSPSEEVPGKDKYFPATFVKEEHLRASVYNGLNRRLHRGGKGARRKFRKFAVREHRQMYITYRRDPWNIATLPSESLERSRLKNGSTPWTIMSTVKRKIGSFIACTRSLGSRVIRT